MIDIGDQMDIIIAKAVGYEVQKDKWVRINNDWIAIGRKPFGWTASRSDTDAIAAARKYISDPDRGLGGFAFLCAGERINEFKFYNDALEPAYPASRGETLAEAICRSIIFVEEYEWENKDG